ncbi:MAG: hypothetical protein ACI9G1_003670 [Pirellulaceae bacterium]
MNQGKRNNTAELFDMYSFKRTRNKWRGIGRFILLTAIALSVCGLISREVRSQSSKEYNLKLAFLYNFTKYVAYPATAFKTADAPFVIGIVGTDPFGASLDRLAKKRTAQRRSIEVMRLSSSDDFSACHVLFVSRSLSSAKVEEIISASTNKPILLVGDDEGFARRGGVMNFYLKSNETIGMEINATAARERLLTVNAKLLSLARVVESQ